MENTPAHFLVRGRIAGKKKDKSRKLCSIWNYSNWLISICSGQIFNRRRLLENMWFINMDEAARGT